MERQKVIALVPNYNEAGKIGVVLKKFTAGLVDEIVVVDDGSTDGSTDEIKAIISHAPVKMTLIEHGRNRGAGAVVRTAIDYARANHYDIFTLLAGNGKDDPQEIPKVVGPVMNEGYDYIQGSRFLVGGAFDNLPLPRKLMIKSFTLFMRLFTGFHGTDATNGFRAYRLSLFNDPRINIWQDWLDRSELEMYLHFLVIKLKYRVKEVPVAKIYPKQPKGQKKIRYSKIRPFVDWWKIIRPVIYLQLRIKH